MKRLALVLTALVFVTGCEDMTGLLKVSEKFSVFSNGRSREIPVGNHSTTLDFERESISATIKYDGREVKVVINLRNVTLPENGPFELKSEQSGQPFDTKGSVQTEITRSELISEKEMCQYQTQEPVCDQHGCTIQTVTKNGWRDIEYFNETTDKKLQFDTYSKSGQAQSHFDGASNTTAKRITFEGRCF